MNPQLKKLNFEKLVQVVNYILQKYNYELNYTKLIKILYIADRECLDKWNFAISGDSYCLMKQGPVLSGLYDLIRNSPACDPIQKMHWNVLFKKRDYDLVSLSGRNCHYDGLSDYDELSDGEMKIMDDVDAKYHDKDWNYLVDNVVHKFPEWTHQPCEKGVIPLKKETILKALHKSDAEIEEILEVENAVESLWQDLAK